MTVRTARTTITRRSAGSLGRPRAVSALAAGALVLALGACGDQGAGTPEQPAQETSPAAEAPATPAETGAATDAATDPATDTEQTQAAPADAEAHNQGALAAIATAAEAAGGTAYEIDDQDDDRSWEIDVMVGNRSVEVEVSADGATVVSQEDDDDMDSDDVQRLNRAGTTLEQAIEAALAEVPGTLDDVELDTEDGVDIWEVSIDTADGDDVEVYVATDDARIVKVDR